MEGNEERIGNSGYPFRIFFWKCSQNLVSIYGGSILHTVAHDADKLRDQRNVKFKEFINELKSERIPCPYTIYASLKKAKRKWLQDLLDSTKEFNKDFVDRVQELQNTHFSEDGKVNAFQKCDATNGEQDYDSGFFDMGSVAETVKMQDDSAHCKASNEKLYRNCEDSRKTVSYCVLACIMWYPEKVLHTVFLDYESLLIKPPGKKRITYKKAIEEYLKENHIGVGVIRIPPVVSHEDRFRKGTQNVKNLTLYSDEEIEHVIPSQYKQINELNIRRDSIRCVEIVAHTLASWANKSQVDMVIFTNYAYKSYLRFIDSSHTVTSQVGDYDVLAICRQIGVIFIQVKYTKSQAYKTVLSDVKKAFSQILKDNYTFFESNRDLSFIWSIPTYSYVAFPSLQKNVFSELNICDSHKEFIITAADLKTTNALNKAMNLQAKLDNSHMLPKNYQLLCARYAGPISKAKPGNLQALIQKTGKKLGSGFLFLEQKHIHERGAKLQIIVGNYGTGKSVLLAQRAYSLAKYDPISTVYLLVFPHTTRNPTLLIKHLKTLVNGQEFVNFKVSSLFETDSEAQMCSLETFFEHLKLLSSTVMGTCHFFIDEVPYQLFKDFEKLQSLLCMFPNSTIWMATTKSPIFFSSQPDLNGRELYINHLSTVKTIPGKLAQMIARIEESAGLPSEMKLGHVLAGPVPLLFRAPPCECLIADFSYKHCTCLKVRILSVLKRTMIHLKDISCDDIVIMTHQSLSLYFMNIYDILVTSLKKLGYEAQLNVYKRSPISPKRSSGGQSILIVDDTTFTGCKSQVVIGFDLFGMNQWFPYDPVTLKEDLKTSPFTRCLSQYVHVTFMPHEAEHLWKLFLEQGKDSLNPPFVAQMSIDLLIGHNLIIEVFDKSE